MSLILDALNRSRQDSEQMPGLSSVHSVETPAPDSHWLQWLLVSALGLAVLAIGWLLLERSPQAVTAPPAKPARVVAPVARPDPEKQAPVKTPVVAPQAKPAIVSTPAVPESPAAEPVASTATRPDTSPAAEEHTPPEIDEGIAALYQQPAQSVPPPAQAAPLAQQSRAEGPADISRVEEPVDIEKLVAQAQAELRDASLSEHAVPLLASLSQQTKDGIPTLIYERHDYSSDPARSSVVINGKTLGAGASGGGVKVEEILPDSVVLEVRGVRFRLRALNSWVNL
ncbi:MAG: general secretion pathway protein GspB [Halieaceae bacterium]|nr:general secretion pathway protein GspB [Halieaceae bacterium]